MQMLRGKILQRLVGPDRKPQTVTKTLHRHKTIMSSSAEHVNWQFADGAINLSTDLIRTCIAPNVASSNQRRTMNQFQDDEINRSNAVN